MIGLIAATAVGWALTVGFAALFLRAAAERDRLLDEGRINRVEIGQLNHDLTEATTKIQRTSTFRPAAIIGDDGSRYDVLQWIKR